MKLSFTAVIVLVLSIQSVHSASHVPYISPGLTISFNSQKVWFVGYKVSIGYTGDQMKMLNDNFFYNVTVGLKVPIRKGENRSGYLFTECEAGALMFPYFPGVGIGAAIKRNEDGKIRIRPKGSVFAGALLFLRSDFVFDEHAFLYDFGGCLTLPIFPVDAFSDRFFDE